MSTLLLERRGSIAKLQLNRPEVRNAFNEELIQELTDQFAKIAKDKTIRVVILSGAGDFFCAGADLHWMSSFVGASRSDNEADAVRFAKMLLAINNCSKPVVAQVHGAAIGGGVGLAAVADIVVASEETFFALSEVKLGLVPAVISPYLISKIGVSASRRYFLTGERFSALQALSLGLVHEQVPLAELVSRVEKIAGELLAGGPEAQSACKALIRKVGKTLTGDLMAATIRTIAERRVSAEGQEGIKAFLEKRKPSWNV